jgi:hypothetical protein
LQETNDTAKGISPEIAMKVIARLNGTLFVLSSPSNCPTDLF